MTSRKLIPLAALAVAVIGFAAQAPSALNPPGSLGTKCGVFPRPGDDVAADAPSLDDQRAWNQDISEAPLDPRSDQIIDAINGDGGDTLHPDFGSPREYGIPYDVVGKRAKKVKVKFTAYGDEADHGKYRVPLNAPVEGGANADGDRHVVVYDKKRCKIYELYRGFPRRSKHRWDADVGVIWDTRSAGLRPEGFTSADAAGLSVFAGLIRFDEVKDGEIDHAIRVTFDTTRDAWVHPASHCAGSTASANAPPMGMRFRMKSRLRHLGLHRSGAGDRRGDEALRLLQRRQRLELVLPGQLRPALGRRQPQPAQGDSGLGVRGGALAGGRPRLLRNQGVKRRFRG